MDALAVLMRLRGGRLLEEWIDALQVTADDVVQTGQAGSVTLKLTIKPLGNPGEVEIAIEDLLSKAPPKKKPHPVIFYAVDGVLHKEDPRQTRMHFEMVETQRAAARETETASAATREA